MDPKSDRDTMAAGFFAQGLALYGLSSNCDNTAKTPMRMAKYFSEMTRPCPVELAVFDEPRADGMIFQEGITFSSMCEHHCAPFFGEAILAYIPANGKVIGLSKLARIVQMCSVGFNTQERITVTSVETLVNAPHLKPRGVAIVMQAIHTCMTCRGVRQLGARTRTQHFAGVFATDPHARSEFWSAANVSLSR